VDVAVPVQDAGSEPHLPNLLWQPADASQ
jgi:hypothetical protein